MGKPVSLLVKIRSSLRSVLSPVSYTHLDVYKRQTYNGGENLPDMPEAGLMFILPESFDRFQWHGRGEHENYIDRKASAFVGTYHSTTFLS